MDAMGINHPFGDFVLVESSHKIQVSIPQHPCMEYLPTLMVVFNGKIVGKLIGKYIIPMDGMGMSNMGSM